MSLPRRYRLILVFCEKFDVAHFSLKVQFLCAGLLTQALQGLCEKWKQGFWKHVSRLIS